MKRKKGLIHHIELYVSDLEKTIEFWGWLLPELGYFEYQKWEKGRSWKLKDSYIVFVQAEKKYIAVPYHRRRVGLNHLAFHAESMDQVDQLTDELKKRGVTVLYPDRHPYAGGSDHYAVYFEDPDRIKVELVAPK
ncbi:VOC family protein [Alkalihalobacillus sp. TS-13]|uniref:VOC family protein n=1 Tax=Alkalihalobacillus sp. TS-13 TaxID=2842455 RepID=UPI001C88D01A|nr:VOC family protein [Alkalihalobacillus sp. TS-13]